MSYLLEIKEVSKHFGNRLVVHPTNLMIQEGSIHIIKGKSGSGKSTLLSIMGGMEKPDNGDVFYKGRSFYKMSDTAQSAIRNRKISYVFQSFHLIPELTVKENIELPLKFSVKSQSIFTAEEIAESLGIFDLLNQYPATLSGGEQQRVAIGRALITNPEIIFADEPTGNLDQKTTNNIMDLLVHLNNEFKITLIVVTHENSLISVPHHSYMMQNGKMKEVSVSYV